MTNRELIEKEIITAYDGNKKLGIYNEEMDKLNKSNLKEVLNMIDYGDSVDVDVNIARAKHVVEVSHVDSEIDFYVMTKKEYIERYGDERYQD